LTFLRLPFDLLALSLVRHLVFDFAGSRTREPTPFLEDRADIQTKTKHDINARSADATAM
jgi:hypothetical protein